MIRYIGTGDYFLGIPKRDLTDEEFAALPAADQAMILASAIYAQDVGEPPAAPRSAKKTTEQPAQAPTSG